MSDLTPDLVREFYRVGCARYGAHTHSKTDCVLMKATAGFLDLIGILNKDDFLTSFTTTLQDNIYIPFDVGVENDHYGLWDQVVILVHELVHVTQYDKNKIGFLVEYAVNKTARAHFEAQAYGADLEMHIWRYGEPYNIRQRAALLSNYGLGKDYIELAYTELLTIADVVENTDGAVSPVAAWAMSWLEQNVPGLKYEA